MSALDVQVGGDHYKKYKIQPAQFIHQNGIGFLAGNVIKYVTRYKDKNGIQDLEKAKHYLDLLIEQEQASLNKPQVKKDTLEYRRPEYKPLYGPVSTGDDFVIPKGPTCQYPDEAEISTSAGAACCGDYDCDDMPEVRSPSV